MQFQIPAYDSLLSTLAVITTVLQYLSGSIVCRKYIKTKSTGDSSGLPFICGFLSCSFWLRYGLYSNEQLLVLVNTIGASLFLLYVIVYYVFTVNKKAYLKQFAVFLTLLLGVLTYTANMENQENVIVLMGYICCIVTVCFFAAPLTKLFHVLRVKNAESLPFPLIAMSFLVSLLWLIYGILISDAFIQIPNFVGCVLSLLQLCLFVCYPPKSFAGPGYKLVDQTAIY